MSPQQAVENAERAARHNPPALVERMPLAAEQPDASPSRADNLVRAAIHVFVLIGVLAFFLYYCLWTPLRLRTAASAPHKPPPVPAVVEIAA